jgi:ABC-2 type transport system permease protein
LTWKNSCAAGSEKNPDMRKIWTIAVREYRAMVATKAFMISVLMMPLLMLGSIAGIEMLRKTGTTAVRKIAVHDPDGQYYLALGLAAESIQQLQAAQMPSADQEGEASLEANVEQTREMLGLTKEKYVFERIPESEFTEEKGLELSARVQRQELYAFLIIPPNVDKVVGMEDYVGGASPKIRFHSQDASLSEARLWIGEVLNGVIRARRLSSENIDPILVQKLSLPVPVSGMGLITKAADGTAQAKDDNNPLSAIFLPMGVMMLMFMVIFMSSQPMLESVLEEKSQRIAEVLLGSANPFQLMSGKLLGTVAGSLTVFLIYLLGAAGLAVYRGWSELIPYQLIPWFIVFQVLGVLFYAAIFLAVGAAVSQLKEAQSLLLPVWTIMMCPMFIWIFIVRDPLGPIATYLSFFPPATPTTMMLRLATGQSIPFWQPLLGIVLLLLGTLAIVFFAARVFRVGILWAGKTPRLSEIFKWALTG